MATLMSVAPDEVRRARHILGFTQLQTGQAFGGVRPETISRWERASAEKLPKVRELHAETMRRLKEAAELIQELYPEEAEREKFLNTPQKELGGRTPNEAMLEDPPYGLRDVVGLLGRIAEGIPT